MSTVHLNRVAHKLALTLSSNSFMIEEELKTYKLTFNVISSLVNASFNFSGVLNLEFFFGNLKIRLKKHISPVKINDKTNVTRNTEPR